MSPPASELPNGLRKTRRSKQRFALPLASIRQPAGNLIPMTHARQNAARKYFGYYTNLCQAQLAHAVGQQAGLRCAHAVVHRQRHDRRLDVRRRRHDDLSQARNTQRDVGLAAARHVEGVERHLRGGLADGLRPGAGSEKMGVGWVRCLSLRLRYPLQTTCECCLQAAAAAAEVATGACKVSGCVQRCC